MTLQATLFGYCTRKHDKQLLHLFDHSTQYSNAIIMAVCE